MMRRPSLRRPESYDPRPHNRQQDLALQKTEFDADTASINRRTQQMNAQAQQRYQQQLAAQAAPKKPAQRPSMLGRLAAGLRRLV